MERLFSTLVMMNAVVAVPHCLCFVLTAIRTISKQSAVMRRWWTSLKSLRRPSLRLMNLQALSAWKSKTRLTVLLLLGLVSI